ncbi:steroid delta-isomerase [Noviherbaspirillum sp. Root189]|nr:steroid delta-isomerase [Noviherbaspirillum sp. Root189]
MAKFDQQSAAPSCPDLDTAKSIVSELASVKSRQDIKAALEIYHKDATLLCPPWQSSSHGRAELEKKLVGFFRLVPDYAVELTGYAMAGETLCTWGTIRMTLSTTPRGDKPNGRKVSTPVFILFRFSEGKVIWESFHFDLADVARQSEVPTEAFVQASGSLSEHKFASAVQP